MENSTDHDNIITLLANVKTLTEEVRLMRDNTKDDIKDLQVGKVDAADFTREILRIDNNRAEDRKNDSTITDALEKKVDSLQRAYFIALGIFGTAEFFAPFILKHFGLI